MAGAHACGTAIAVTFSQDRPGRSRCVGVKQDACARRHGEELPEAINSRAESMFTDPRSAERWAKLDALADRRSIDVNFRKKPSTSVKRIQCAVRRLAKTAKAKR